MEWLGIFYAATPESVEIEIPPLAQQRHGKIVGRVSGATVNDADLR